MNMEYFNELYSKSKYAYSEDQTSIVKESMCYIDENKKNILELGIGEGSDAIFLAKRGFKVTGVDIAEEGLKKVRKRFMKEQLNIHLVKSDICKTYIKPNYYSAIFCIMTIQFIIHEEKRQNLFVRMKQGLVNHGIICIKVKTVEDPQYLYDSKKCMSIRKDNTIWSENFRCNVYYYEENELLSNFLDMHIRSYREYTYSDTTHGEPHNHGVAEIIAEKKVNSLISI